MAAQAKEAPRLRPAPGTRSPHRGWTAGWEADAVLTAGPRWSFGKALMNTPNYGAASMGGLHGPGSTRKPKHKVRETFIDDLLRAEEDRGMGIHMAPGAHDPLPVERVFQPVIEEKHGSKAAARREGGSGTMAWGRCTTVRLANLTSMKQYPRTKLPTCAHTPGPGAYTQFTSFGSPSGPTRESFFPRESALDTTQDSTSPTRHARKV